MKTLHLVLITSKFRQLALTVVVLTFLFGSYDTFAQASPVTPDYKKVPTPPSPNVAALGKFGDIPVSASTGVPNISIPIHSYSDNQKNLNLNVALSYHAGGHKVEDMASNVGLGWALNAGGIISRTMKGLPDEQVSVGYLKTPALPLLNTTTFDSRFTEAGQLGAPPSINAGISQHNDPSNFSVIKMIADNGYDGEADIFNLSVGSINEKFFFNKSGVPIFASPNNLQVITNTSLASFTVIDANGVRYIFDIPEQTQSDNAVEPTVPAPPSYTSSWYLSKIQSADGLDEIQFQYESSASQLLYESGLCNAYRTEHAYNDQVISSGATQSYSYTVTSNARRIKKIILPDKTEVDFTYALSREDYVGDKALTSIKVSGAQFERSFTLQYDYFLSPTCDSQQEFCPPLSSVNNWMKRLKLLSVQEQSGSTLKPPYTFEYNATALPPRSSKKQDWWGYYNGGAVGAIIPHNTLYPPTSSFLGFDRVPSLSHCKAWILEKINYPTGGNTSFTYELNEGISDNVVKPIGGLRVQKIEMYDPLTNATYTTQYTYTKTDNTTSGLLITIPSYTAYWNTMHVLDGIVYTEKRYYFNESLNPTQTLSYFNGSPVIYTRVKEEQLVSGASNGYTVYEFTTGQTDLMHDLTYPFVQKQDLSWERGLPLKTSVYNSSDILLSSEENEYQITSTTPLISDASTRNLITGNYYWDSQSTLGAYLYGARYYYLTRGKSQLSKATKKQYSVGGQVLSTVTEYTYDATYHLPTLMKTTDSKGRTIETRTYYPFNYNLSLYRNMDSLVVANRVGETVSVEEWLIEGGNASVKSITVNDFKTVNTNLVKNTKISTLETSSVIPQSQIGTFNNANMYRSSAIKEKMKIEAFDARGRGIGMKFEGDERQALIWGDHNEFPIASVSNAVPSDIAYTSFEMTEKGNWQYFGIPTSDVTAPTGKKIYALASVPISKNIISAKTYIVSLWRNGSVAVSNSTLKRTGKTIGGWTYEEYLVTGTSTVTISGSGLIDELRLFPQMSQMKSYTFYTPQQIQTETDANGKISRYEYDVMGRLKVIRDEDKNILKSFDYNYKSGQ